MLDAIWDGARERLQRELPAKDFATWIAPLRAAVWAKSELTLESPSAFGRDWLRRHFLPTLEAAVSAASGAPATVRLTVNRELDIRGAASEPPRPVPVLTMAGGRYSFDGFVVGESNRVAYEAARAVVENPGRRFSPLFLYGGVGLGKTHLLSAIAHGIGSIGRNGTVVFVTAEDFVNSMVRALRGDRMEAFRKRFRNVGTLVLDDIQFLAGKRRSQEEFYNTFNALHDGQRQIVLASDNAPDNMPGIEHTLRNRFASGLLADIRSPDPELRLALVRRKAAERQFALDEDVIGYLAETWCANVRELEGALTRLHAVATLSLRVVTVAMARDTLGTRGESASSTVERIIDEVCRHFVLTRAEITSARRTARLAGARQLAMYLCRHHTDVPLTRIGLELGGRDHSTVKHALSAIERKLQQDARLREALAVVRGRLRA